MKSLQKCPHREIRISKLLNNDKISVIIRIPVYGNTDGGFLPGFQHGGKKKTYVTFFTGPYTCCVRIVSRIN